MTSKGSTFSGLTILALILLGWQAQAALAVARLHPLATVSGPEIRLGDIADIESSDELLGQRLTELVVGRAALPGAERRLFVGSVRVRLRQAGIAETAVALEATDDPIRVQTAATPIPAAALTQAAEAAVGRWLKETYGVSVQEITARVSGTVPAVTGDYTLQAGEVSHRPGGGLQVPVNIHRGGRLVGQVSVQCSVTAEVEVLVASRRLERHSPLEPADVRWEQRSVMTVPPEAVTRQDWPSDVDRRLTRSVEDGSVLTLDLLETAPATSAGDEVQLISAVGAVRVADTGMLIDDGYLGRRVAVRNVRTGQTVYGVLVTPGLVEVGGNEH
ncbi:MAG: flagellar basal body P-ring formation chaperone FlgA [Limnochordia bacterium]|jgi:flagella basal body P-ring formation protein FlgA